MLERNFSFPSTCSTPLLLLLISVSFQRPIIPYDSSVIVRVQFPRSWCIDSKWGVERKKTSRVKVTASYIKRKSQSSKHCNSLKMISEWVLSVDVSLQSSPLSLLLSSSGNIHAESPHHMGSEVVPYSYSGQ